MHSEMSVLSVVQYLLFHIFSISAFYGKNFTRQKWERNLPFSLEEKLELLKRVHTTSLGVSYKKWVRQFISDSEAHQYLQGVEPVACCAVEINHLPNWSVEITKPSHPSKTEMMRCHL